MLREYGLEIVLVARNSWGDWASIRRVGRVGFGYAVGAHERRDAGYFVLRFRISRTTLRGISTRSTGRHPSTP